MYGGKGEIKHLTFEDTVYGPEFELFKRAYLGKFTHSFWTEIQILVSVEINIIS